MATHEDYKQGIELGKGSTKKDLIKIMNKYLKGKTNDDVVYFCIGTDRSTGDSLAPMIGTMLQQQGYNNVIGTLEFPAHAKNLDERIKEIPEGKFIIAIDASLGKTKSIGKFFITKGQMKAGASVGKELTPVGDISIAGVVNIASNDDELNFFVLQNTRLSSVHKMASEISQGLMSVFPLESTTYNHITAVN